MACGSWPPCSGSPAPASTGAYVGRKWVSWRQESPQSAASAPPGLCSAWLDERSGAEPGSPGCACTWILPRFDMRHFWTCLRLQSLQLFRIVFFADMLRRHLPVPLTFEVARTLVPATEWANARAGDAVVFGPYPSKSSVDEIPAQLICGAFSALVGIRKDNTARVTRLFTPIIPTERNSMSDETILNHAQAVIAGAPIEVVAECGRITLPADELLSLRPGAVLPLGSAEPTNIQLRVGGRLWARGELVNVDGQLGVRVTSLAPE